METTVAELRRLPWILLLAAGSLMLLGLIGIGHATSDGGTSRLFHQQLVWSCLAIASMTLVAVPHYRWLRHLAYAGLAACLVMLLAVYLFPAVNGSHRWIRVGPIGFQPSELTKLFFVAAVASWLSTSENQRRLIGLAVPLLLAVVPAVLILREPDLGTALVFLPVLFCMLIAAGARLSHVGLIALAGLLMLPLFWSLMSREQISRVTAVVEQTGPHERPNDDGYHLHRAKQLVGLGGITGYRNAGAARRDSYVPAAATDSIFVVICHRYGLFGASLVLVCYLLLCWQMLRIAQRTEDPFAQLVVVGIAAIFSVQASINTAMMLGMLPITGLSLPLVSYGGTGLLVHALSIGLVVSIGRRPTYAVAGSPFRFVRRAAA